MEKIMHHCKNKYEDLKSRFDEHWFWMCKKCVQIMKWFKEQREFIIIVNSWKNGSNLAKFEHITRITSNVAIIFQQHGGPKIQRKWWNIFKNKEHLYIWYIKRSN